MKREENYALLLLAGGKNKRMKTNKAKLLYEGKTFAEHMISKACALGITRIYVSGFEPDCADGKAANIYNVCDEYPDRGPLGGIHACMKAMQTPFCLVLPIDAPEIPPDVLEELLDYHEKHRSRMYGSKTIPLIWEHGNRKEPLIGIYPTDMANAIEKFIKEKPAPVFRVLDFWGYERFRKEIPEQTIINVNTPELYSELMKNSEKKTISIQKIGDGVRCDKNDEVALEHHVEIPLKDGQKIRVACTPTYIEELILGRRFLLDDLTAEEAGRPENTGTLNSISQRDIFRIANEMFETPGSLFQTTGCAHSCVLVKNGKALISIEDIGRHNALDKIIGYALKNRIPIPDCAVFCSGRVSEDYLEKAVTAGFKIVVSRAAVTAGAVDLAKRADITLLGFVRKGSGNVYHEGTVVLKV